MKDIKVGVSSIGSGIGQSIINALNLSSLQVDTVGFGNAPFEYGALDCGSHHQVPAIKDPDYVERLIELCLEEGVDLLIPGLDDDLLVLSEKEEEFLKAGIEVLAASHGVISLCRDKYQLSEYFQSRTNVFVRGYLPDEFREALNQGKCALPCVAKPRGGSGSLGVRLVKDEQDLEDAAEDAFLQPLLRPAPGDAYAAEFQEEVRKGRVPQVSELSVQILTGKDGAVLGKLATINKLKHGVPIEIFPVDREEIWTAVDQVVVPLLEMGLRGPVNLQGRITGEGVRFFEANPRFTGITGLRAQLGFNGVEACLRNWLDLPDPGAVLRTDLQKFGLRQVADRVVALEHHRKAADYHQKLNIGKSDPRRVLLITGSTGYLGQNLIPALDLDRYRLWILTTHPEQAAELHGGQVEEIFGESVFSKGGLPWGRVDLLLHAGFARPHQPESELARSLEFTQSLVKYAGSHMVPALINISSQSIYGQGSPPPWDEAAPASPRSAYAAAKYAAELMVRAERDRHPHLHWTSLRLAGLTGGAPGLVPVDLVTRFVDQALRGEPLEIRGDHRFERLDIRDAVQGLIKFIAVPAEEWEPVYNLGRGETFSIHRLAEAAAEQIEPYRDGNRSRVVTNIQDPPLAFGMDSSRFYQLTGWQPEYNLEETIRSLIVYLKKGAGYQQGEG
jgi:nucleoside-diphosphate-sugar epimerase